MPNGPYTWNAKAARYRDASGRFVSPGAVRAWLDRATDRERRIMQRAGRAFRSGEWTAANLAEFERVMRAGIKTTHLMAAMSARGGYAQMTSEDYGRVGQTIRFHYGKLEAWMRDIARGTAPLDGTVASRAVLYAGASLGTHYRVAGEVALAAGMTEEINVLGDVDRHCDTCLQQTRLSPAPIGTLVPIGQRRCLGNCACTLEFR